MPQIHTYFMHRGVVAQLIANPSEDLWFSTKLYHGLRI